MWLADDRRFALFPTGTIARDPHNLESPTRCKQDRNLKLCSSDNHYIMAPQLIQLKFLSLLLYF